MGFLRNAKMAKTTNNMTERLEMLWNAPFAYRPSAFHVRDEDFPLDRSLNGLAELGNQIGLSAGDVLVLSVHLLEGVDQLGSARQAMQRTFDAVGTGQLKTVSGFPMNRFAHPQAILNISLGIVRMGRVEAFREYVETDQRATG